VALTVIRHESCCSQQQHVHRPLLLAARGRGSVVRAPRSLSRISSGAEQSRAEHLAQHMPQPTKSADGNHDIFAVALTRTWVSKVSAPCRYSASSASGANRLDLEAHHEFDKADITIDDADLPIHEQHLPCRGRADLGGSRSWLSILTSYLVEPAGDLLSMAGLGEEVQPPYCSTLAVDRLHAYPHPARTGTAQERLDHETAKVGH
jgi:hypothetical protein